MIYQSISNINSTSDIHSASNITNNSIYTSPRLHKRSGGHPSKEAQLFGSVVSLICLPKGRASPDQIKITSLSETSKTCPPDLGGGLPLSFFRLFTNIHFCIVPI